MHPITRLLTASIAAITALASFNEASAQGPTPVFVAPVVQETTQEFERVIGSLRAKRISEMAALEEGALIELAVREADVVAQGDVIARIDDRRLKASRAQLEADLAMAGATLTERQAQLTNAKADLDAIERASKSGAISDRDLRNARTAVQTSEALANAAQQSITALEAQRDLLDLRLADTVVRAPFAATVTMRHAEIGQWIRPGDPLVTLVSTGALEAWLDIPERLVGRVDTAREAMQVHLEASGQDVKGTKARSVPTVDMRARTFNLILDIANDANALHPGMSISAQIPVGQPAKHLVVPKDAIVRRGDSALLVVVDAESKAQYAPVRVLFASGAGFAVESLVPGGLTAGTQVVVEGNERTFPGTPVAPTPVSEKPQQGE